MTTLDLSKSTVTNGAVLATGAIACTAYQALALILLHVLRADLTPASNFISNYAVGPFGWVMTTWFVAGACSILLLSLGLARGGLKTVTARIAMFLMVVEALGLLVSAAFPVDPPGAPSTRTGDIHDYSFLANIINFVLIPVLLPFSFGSHPSWRSFRPMAWALAGLIAFAFVIQIATLHKGMPYGIANRFFVAAILAWNFAMAARLRAALLSRC